MEPGYSAPSTNIPAVETCPNCGLELVGERAICACDTSLLLQPQEDKMIGQTLTSYKIVEVIGRGGMGIIYKAHDQWMDRTIAIKMLHQNLVNDPQSVQRFNQEAKAAGKIEHPNVIQAYDFGVAPVTDQPYLVMEYLQGQSLADLIDSQKQIEPERAVNIFVQVCDALAAAHAKSILHRDLKPSNIMLVATKEQADFVKIVDFGIAKMMPGTGKEVNLTQTGEVFGSPLYMSPEQFVGRKVDVRSDIYSMGCVMYEALTGKPPIVGEHVLETMYKHMNEQPKRFAEARPDLKISPKLEAIVLRALEKEPDQRYQSMTELHDALMLTKAGFKDRRPLHVKMRSGVQQIRRFSRRYTDVAGNALLVVLSMVIFGCIAASVVMWMRSSQESQWHQLKQEAQVAYAREDFDGAKVKLMNAAKIALDNFGDEDPRYIDTLKRLAWVLNASGDYSHGRTLFKKVYKLTEEELSKIRIAQIPLSMTNLLNEMWVNENATEGAEKVLRRASETLEKYLGSNDPELIPLLEQLALVYEAQVPPMFEEAETQYLRIFSIMRETEGDESVGAAFAHKMLGDLYTKWSRADAASNQKDDSDRHHDDAMRNYQDAYQIYSKLLGKDSAQAQGVQDRLNGKQDPAPVQEQTPQQPEQKTQEAAPMEKLTIPEF